MKSYRTAKKEAENEFVERKSRFIGAISPAKTEQEALDFIEKKKSEHWQATHNCWAYVIRENTTQRYSDDGEPQGTAGIPILEILKKEEIFDAVIVVTRYYGGIQLGAGGLIRAYSQGAKLALDAGGVVVMAPCHILKVTLPYSLYDHFMSLSESYPMKLLQTDFSENVSLELRLQSDYLAQMSEMLTELSAGSVTAEIIGETFAPI